MSMRELRHDRPSGRFSKSWGLLASHADDFRGAPLKTPAWEARGLSASLSFLFPHPHPALLLAPFFARSLTLVPPSLLLNRTETLATQAKEKKSEIFFKEGIKQNAKMEYCGARRGDTHITEPAEPAQRVCISFFCFPC